MLLYEFGGDILRLVYLIMK